MTADRPALGAFRRTMAIPVIPRGLGRMLWFESLDEAVAADVMTSLAEMREDGWTVSGAHDAIVGCFARYITTRLSEAIAVAADVAAMCEAGEA